MMKKAVQVKKKTVLILVLGEGIKAQKELTGWKEMDACSKDNRCSRSIVYLLKKSENATNQLFEMILKGFMRSAFVP